MPTIISEGSQAAVIGTEHYLVSDNTSNKVFVFTADTSPMLASDGIEFRIITKVRTGSPPKLAYYAPYFNTQFDPNKYSVPVPADVSFTATLKQTQGTGRTIDWKVLSIPSTIIAILSASMFVAQLYRLL